MGVLEQMRSSSDSTFMQVVLALVVIAFVGVYARQQGPRIGVAATVDGVRIMETDVNRAYVNVRDYEQMRRNRTLNDQEEKQLWEQTKQQLIQRQVMLHEAERLGIEVSDKEVARLLMEQFSGEDGKFSRERYENNLKRSGLSTDAFEARIREDLVIDKLQRMALLGANLSETELREAYIEQETKVEIDFVEIRPFAFEGDVTVSEEERDAFLESDEAQVKAAYDRDYELKYKHPAKVRMSVIRLAISPDGPAIANLVPRLNRLREELVDGAEFGDLARKWSEDESALQGGDMGLRAVKQFSEKEIEETKDLKLGEVSRVIPSDSDVRLLRVEERVGRPGGSV